MSLPAAVERLLDTDVERARVAARLTTGQLKLLPRGVRLLTAPDPVEALRELL